MNLPTILNIAIGLVFIYLVLSLLASQIQEVVATLLQWRAQHLIEAIEHLILGDSESSSESLPQSDLVDKLFDNPLVKNLNHRSKSWGAGILKWISSQKCVSSMAKKISTGKKSDGSSYMSAEVFSSTLLNELNIPKAVRLLTWLNARKLIHYEIELKIEAVLDNNQLNNDPIKSNYEALKSNFKEVLQDYKESRYDLSATLIRLRNQTETFKRQIQAIPTNPDLDEQKLKSINQIFDFIFTADKNLLIRLIPSLTKTLDLLIPNVNLELESTKLKEAALLKKTDLELKLTNEVGAEKTELETDLSKINSQIEQFQKEFERDKDLFDSYHDVQKDLIAFAEHLPENLRQSLYALALRSRIKAVDLDQQMDRFKQEIETWFDESMERASGVYKRNARGFTFLIGFGLAFALNADTIHIVSRLSKDDILRTSIVTASSGLVQTIQSTPITSPSPAPIASPIPSSVDQLQKEVDQSLSQIPLPIGWDQKITQEQDQRGVFVKILGWLLTAIAIMMGAPFWFDLLGLFINVRNTGAKPESKTDKK